MGHFSIAFSLTSSYLEFCGYPGKTRNILLLTFMILFIWEYESQKET